ncbi:heme ABC exporter ATP-binding protein CcmA [Chelativorans salis]|uniref:Heme ABC exporter ATP-binding protein CcmA n=1 Tax=Chelativorans salis TaxID=2978478 RepID=A0ABT2LQ02_9HYPH|nr:heme ABC exporter ATP-binding protein CcmA [Chelativorans sp. EGI FJ00035]MCT7376509.1 heme ABC exporter ATP-binding protein CcmA [Chelativorans sp. EGI FJ00035]
MRLAAEALSGERGGEVIFSGTSFAVACGEALLVTGPNGAGKTTLLRILAGLLRPAAGRLALDGGGEEWPDVGPACHYLGHFNAMKTALTVEENLVFWQRFLGQARMTVSEALEAVGLEDIEHLPFGYLSTGQRRRAAIARLLISYRPVWLLDEPTAGLDRASEGRFGQLMRGHLREGGMIVAATHLPLGLEGAGELRMGEEAT